jgi:hypothetical protein
MKQLLKSWLPVISGTRKFLATDLAHRLSRVINRRNFEVVFEGFIDLHNINSEQPDIVVYNKEDGLKPVMILEICDNQSQDSTLRTMEILGSIYHVDESFIFNMESGTWLLYRNESPEIEKTSYSRHFNTDISRLLYQHDHLRIAV